MTDKITKKPKGFAFVEFADATSLRKGLAFHHSMFQKRAINVEMTAGGGGKSESRLKKLSDKNHRLDKERERLFQQRSKQKPEMADTGEVIPSTAMLKQMATGANSVYVKSK